MPNNRLDIDNLTLIIITSAEERDGEIGAIVPTIQRQMGNPPLNRVATNLEDMKNCPNFRENSGKF